MAYQSSLFLLEVLFQGYFSCLWSCSVFGHWRVVTCRSFLYFVAVGRLSALLSLPSKPLLWLRLWEGKRLPSSLSEPSLWKASVLFFECRHLQLYISMWALFSLHSMFCYVVFLFFSFKVFSNFPVISFLTCSLYCLISTISGHFPHDFLLLSYDVILYGLNRHFVWLQFF